ncbi:MAG: D-alanyl-D-alanine carboxypeptidase family protein [Oryzihumus sp.]
MRSVCRAVASGALALSLTTAGVSGAGDALAAPAPSPTPTASPTSGSTAGATPTPAASATPTPGVDAQLPAGAGEQPALTPAQLSSQIAAADRLRAGLIASSAKVATATARIDRLSGQSATVLAQLSVARRAEAAARAEALRQLQRFRSLDAAMQADQDSVGRWAHDAYVNGGPLADYMTFMQVLSTPDPEQAADPMAILQYVAAARGRALDRLQGLTAAQQDAADRAEKAGRDAIAAAARIQAAKARLDTLLVQQRAALADLRQSQADQLLAAGSVRGALLRSHDPEARAADSRLAQALQTQGTQVFGDPGTPCHASTATYPNGQIPALALCPLYAAPGKGLRPAAAAAFNAMSRAYEKETGSPLCVTDAYRSLAGQVAVAKSRPGFAAVPGTSNHGLGLAVDLCGGVQSFGSSAHWWMQTHAPLYGWFHPAWAEPTGVLPEPWHWEFAQ